MTWDFYANHKDAIDAIATIIGVVVTAGGIIWAVFKWGISRWRANKIRVEVKVFELITDSASLLPKLYLTEDDDSPLADHRIKYQPRDPKRDLQAELKAALNRSRYLLITAPTGYGKTREGGMLAQTMMQEGWRVLRVRLDEWLDTPKTLPKELGGNRSRVLILLDDLNGLFSAGNAAQSPRVENEKSLLLSQLSYHDRLLQVLDLLETMCTASEIRVIATARSEAEQWKILEYNENDRLWKRFERIEIPEPADSAIVELLKDATKQADLKADESEFEAIARQSDGTYRNILLNLRRYRTQNKPVNKNDFTDTLDGSWRDVYERAVKQHPAVEYLYCAMDALRQARIDLFPFLVEPAALMIWGGNFFQKLLRRRQIKNVLRYLTRETKILRLENGKLAPSDGQIEVRKTQLVWAQFSKELERLLFENIPQHGRKLTDSLLLYGVKCYESGNVEQAIGVWERGAQISPKGYFWYNLGVAYKDLQRYAEAEASFRKAIELNPLDAAAYNNLGNTLHHLQRYEEAEASYRKAIELNPSHAGAYYNLGILLKNLQRYAEAEASFRKAIEFSEASPSGENPSLVQAYSNLGSLLDDLKRYEEAEASYRKAIELNPSYATAYSNLGSLLDDLKRYEEAEASYRKAIELNPSYATAYYNLGILLKNLQRYAEAEASYRKAIELSEASPSGENPSDARAYNNLVILLRTLGRQQEALSLLEKMMGIDPEDFNSYLGIASIKRSLGETIEPELVEKARALIPADDFYNRACLESVCANADLAFEYLQKAAQKEKFNPAWAWRDPDLQWIRSDPRFEQMVGKKPES